ncbi:MAG: hypothetical protein MMC33_001587 [Icmadophila ericetorum]|nr:hypothetical protein [Icmadophila ericetorum]
MPKHEEKGKEISYYEILEFKFHLSGRVMPIKVAYHNYNPSSPKKVLIPTCYGGRVNDTLDFTSGALKDHNVVVAAMLGNGESSSPSNDPDFPTDLRYQDVIHAHYQLLTAHLGIEQLEAVIGFSMGGQQAYYWSCMYPSFVKAAVPICGSAKTSFHNWAFLEGPKSALLNSVDYADGEYKVKGAVPKRGLHGFGRAYCAWAMSAAWFREERWGKGRDGKGGLGYGSVEEFMVEQWEAPFESWDSEDLLVLARMWQAGDVGSTRADGDYTKALEEVKARVLIMPARTDQYFPPEDSEIELKYLKHGKLAVIETIWGHLAGGGANAEDTDFMDKQIAEFLKE